MEVSKAKKADVRERKTVHVYIDSDFNVADEDEEIYVETLDFVEYHAPRDKGVRLCFSDELLFGRLSETIDAGKSKKLKVFPNGKLYSTLIFDERHECRGGGGNESKTKVGGG